MAPAVNFVFVCKCKVTVSFCNNSFYDLFVEVFDFLWSWRILNAIFLHQIVDETFTSGEAKLAIRSKTPSIDFTFDCKHYVMMITSCYLLDLVYRVMENYRNRFSRECNRLTCDWMLITFQKSHLLCQSFFYRHGLFSIRRFI